MKRILQARTPPNNYRYRRPTGPVLPHPPPPPSPLSTATGAGPGTATVQLRRSRIPRAGPVTAVAVVFVRTAPPPRPGPPSLPSGTRRRGMQQRLLPARCMGRGGGGWGVAVRPVGTGSGWAEPNRAGPSRAGKGGREGGGDRASPPRPPWYPHPSRGDARGARRDPRSPHRGRPGSPFLAPSPLRGWRLGGGGGQQSGYPGPAGLRSGFHLPSQPPIPQVSPSKPSLGDTAMGPQGGGTLWDSGGGWGGGWQEGPAAGTCPSQIPTCDGLARPRASGDTRPAASGRHEPRFGARSPSLPPVSMEISKDLGWETASIQSVYRTVTATAPEPGAEPQRTAPTLSRPPHVPSAAPDGLCRELGQSPAKGRGGGSPPCHPLPLRRRQRIGGG